MDALALGLALGLAAGISPGPLLVLVITSTLRDGWRAGVTTACAPLLSDALIVATTLAVLDQLSHRVLSVIGVVGGAFVIWTGIATVREARSTGLEVGTQRAPRSLYTTLGQAATVNLLSPHPWVAWATALGPLTIATWRNQPTAGAALVAGFYVTLVGAKIGVAALVAGGRRRLTDRGYRRALIAAGALLVLAGVALAAEFAPNAF